MNKSLNHHTDLNQTIRQVLPYAFFIRADGKMIITNTRGQKLIVARADVVNILKKDDLDVHRRRMYEAALAEFDTTDAGKVQ